MKKIIIAFYLFIFCNCEKREKIIYVEKKEKINCKCIDTYSEDVDIEQDRLFQLVAQGTKAYHIRSYISTPDQEFYQMPVGLYQKENQRFSDYIEKNIVPNYIKFKDIIPREMLKCNYYIVIQFDIDKNGFLSNIKSLKENRKCDICKNRILKEFINIKKIKLKSFAKKFKVNRELHQVTQEEVTEIKKHTDIVALFYGKKYYDD